MNRASITYLDCRCPAVRLFSGHSGLFVAFLCLRGPFQHATGECVSRGSEAGAVEQVRDGKRQRERRGAERRGLVNLVLILQNGTKRPTRLLLAGA